MNYRLPLVTVVLLSFYTVSGSEELSNDQLSDSSNSNDDAYSRVRRSFNMLRLGRGLQMLRLGKRALPMLRLGRAPENSLNDDDFQYLLSIMRNDRQVPLPRYGKDLAFQYVLMKAMKNAADDNSDDYYEDMNAPQFDGYGYGYPTERQIRPAPRPGRYRRSAVLTPPKIEASESDNVPMDPAAAEEYYDIKSPFTRVAPLMRYGKEAEFDNEESDFQGDDVDKRAMRMLRLGRGMRMLRLGKRPVDAEGEEVMEGQKRALRLLRLGKRPAFHMLRLGRSGEEYPGQEKRALRLLRLGKRSETEES